MSAQDPHRQEAERLLAHWTQHAEHGATRRLVDLIARGLAAEQPQPIQFNGQTVWPDPDGVYRFTLDIVPRGDR